MRTRIIKNSDHLCHFFQFQNHFCRLVGNYECLITFLPLHSLFRFHHREEMIEFLAKINKLFHARLRLNDASLTYYIGGEV